MQASGGHDVIAIVVEDGYGGAVQSWTFVEPETWTHGSAAQRSGAFRRGMVGGLAGCGIPAGGASAR